MKNRFYRYILKMFLFIAIVQLFSCSPKACYEDTESLLKANFYGYSTLKTAAPDSVTMYGLSMESDKLYNKTANLQPARKPLNASSPKCTYIIRINGVTDTIQLWYSSYPHLISKECGYAFFHNLDSLTYTKNKIDSISKSNSNITTINVENIRIFY